MDSDTIEREKNFATTDGPHDEVDFSSGYEKQYAQEYRPLRPIVVSPPDKKNAWYRDLTTILMTTFLAAIFIIGTVLLVMQVFTASPMKIFIITGSYVVIAAVIIFLEVKSVHVR